MFDFVCEYLKNPFAVGAIKASSKHLAQGMVNDIDFNQCNNIVEYGPGTGIFTEEIIKRKKSSSKFIVIEQNKVFYEMLLEKYRHIKNVYIINGSVENIGVYLAQYEISYIDVVISGLPFSSLPKVTTDIILGETRKYITDDGSFIAFQYTLFKKNVFKKYFNISKIKKVFLNFPPANVLVMNKNYDILY